MLAQDLKKKIFPRYIGKRVRVDRINKIPLTLGLTDSDNIDLEYSLNNFECHILVLKSLHDITDEDAIKVASITMRRHNRHYKPEEISYAITHRNTKDQIFAIEINVSVNELERYKIRLESNDFRVTDVPVVFGKNCNPGAEYPATNQLEVFQFLEEAGYALPYMEYSVQDLIDLEVIELE